MDTDAVLSYLNELQTRIVGQLEVLDGGRFRPDAWTRGRGDSLEGSGLSCLLEDGVLLERAGVGFSHVRGGTLPPSASASRRWPQRWNARPASPVRPSRLPRAS